MQYKYRLIWKIVEKKGRQFCVGNLPRRSNIIWLTGQSLMNPLSRVFHMFFIISYVNFSLLHKLLFTIIKIFNSEDNSYMLATSLSHHPCLSHHSFPP